MQGEQIYNWVVIDSELMGGLPTVKGTRLTAAFILTCLSDGMTPHEIATDYPGFPAECVPELLKFAANQLDAKYTHVAVGDAKKILEAYQISAVVEALDS